MSKVRLLTVLSNMFIVLKSNILLLNGIKDIHGTCNAEHELVEQSFSHREKPTEGGAYVGRGKSVRSPHFSETAVDT